MQTTSSGLVLALSVVALFMQACTNTYKMEVLPIAGTADSTAPPYLKVGDTVSVPRPQDGQYGGKSYQGSGTAVQLAVISCLKQRGVEAEGEVGPGGSRPATSSRCWTIKISIMEWEDRATEWSGLPDRIRIALQTVEPDGTVRDSTVVSGSSKWATFGGDHPQDMLTPALTPWAARLVDGVTPVSPPSIGTEAK
jgi:hypothetical protein